MSSPSVITPPTAGSNCTSLRAMFSPSAIPASGMIDWARISSELDSHGSALIARLISPAQCDTLAALYADESRFRSRVVMARHGFGRGEYKYFSYPLPEPIVSLRRAIYPQLA